MATFGSELRRWRTARRYSQLRLAAEAGVSQRHLSFLERGQAKPSREMVIHLGTVLDIPLRRRNELLLAAGFAPVYPETPLDAPAMRQIRHVLEFILAAHEPFPAFVVDRRWNIVFSNRAAVRLTTAVVDPTAAPVAGGTNLARIALHPDGIRPHTVDWERTAAHLLARLEHEVADRAGDAELAALLDEVLAYPGVAGLNAEARPPTGTDLLLPLHFRTRDLELRLFSTFSTIGAPYDVTLEELRLETFFPADENSERTLRALANSARSTGSGT